MQKDDHKAESIQKFVNTLNLTWMSIFGDAENL